MVNKIYNNNNVSNDVIEFFNKYEFPPPIFKESNIFDSGMHNMYENPFTEILSFILNKNTPYKDRENFIKYFIYELTENNEIADSFCKELDIDTQVYTKSGKFIDAVIFNDDYVITLENKIEHIPINPFEEYEEEINTRYKGQKKLFYLFSFNECESIRRWTNKLIREVFFVIKKKLIFGNNKWDYFVQDYLSHYSKEEIKMIKNDFLDCEKIFSKLMKGRDLLNDYTREIINQINTKLKPNRIETVKWEGAIGMRIKPFKEDYPDVVLLLSYKNLFYVNIYYTDQIGKSISELSELVGIKYRQWLESKGKYICFGLREKQYFDSFENVFNELDDQINKMKQIVK